MCTDQRGSRGAGGDGMRWRTCWGCPRDSLGTRWECAGMHWRCTGDADPAAQRRAGALPCSAGLPVTSNELLCSCFRAGAAWPAGGLVAVSELPLCVTRMAARAAGPALHAAGVSRRLRAALLMWLLYSSYCSNTFRHSTSVICLDVISSFVSAN